MNAHALAASPIRSVTVWPMRAPSHPASGPQTIIATDDGRKNRPASTSDASNPKPATASSTCTNAGISTKNAVSEKPTSTVAALVHAIPGRANVLRSTSGSGTRRSTRTQTTNQHTDATANPTTRTDSQPQAEPFVTASSRHTSAALNTAAPSQSGRPPRRTGDSGTNAQISALATSTGAPPITNSQCQLRFSSTKPLPTRPIAPPMPNTLETIPTATPTRSAGNSSRMIPKLSGKTAAPVPWSTRHATSQPSESPAAAASDPSAEDVTGTPPAAASCRTCRRACRAAG